ncbi:MAG: SiaB family protein kinase [Cytophagales bacterium]|nr:SiaB family protein kinase [Cytophagales bacterium]
MSESYTESSLKYVHEMHNYLKKNNIIFGFEGGFTQTLTKNILSVTEQRLNNQETDLLVKKRVFNVMVECLQNIVKHADEIDSEEYDMEDGIFLIGRDERGYFLVSGNLIPNESISIIQNKLELINRLDKEALRELYLNELSQSVLSDRGTAGLGFIDMARKSGNKLEFSFQQVTDEVSFYILRTTITKA